MAKKNPEICPYCGHVILDDDQEYCDYCGSDIEKEEIPDNKKSAGSCLGVLMTVFFVFLLISIFIIIRP